MAAHDVTPTTERARLISKRTRKNLTAIGAVLAALLAIFALWDRLFPTDLSDAARIDSVAITKHTTLSDYELSNPDDGLSVEPVSESAPAYPGRPDELAGTVALTRELSIRQRAHSDVTLSLPVAAPEPTPTDEPTPETTTRETADGDPQVGNSPSLKPSGDPTPTKTPSPTPTIDDPKDVQPVPPVSPPPSPPQQLPEDPSPDVPSEVPEQVPPPVPAEVPEQVPPQVPGDISVQPPSEVPGDISVQPPSEVPGDISVQAPPAGSDVVTPEGANPADPIREPVSVPAPAKMNEDYRKKLEVEPALRKYTTKTVHNAVSLLPPQPPAGGDLPSVEDSAAQLASLLDKVETEEKPGGLEVQGWTVAVGLSIEGLTDEPLTLTWSLDGIDEDNSWPETGPGAYDVVASTANDTGTVDIWVPNLQATGDYNLNVRLIRKSNGHIIASSLPLLFAGNR